MSTGLRDVSAQARLMAVATVGSVLALLVPSMLTTGTGGPASVATLALVLALAVVHHHLGSRQVVPLPTAGAVIRSAGHAAPPLLRARATDPVHHPLRPRAPGQA